MIHLEGWVCYAEKTHGDFVLPYISTTKSPQQIMGSIVKQYFAKELKTTLVYSFLLLIHSPDKIYHVAIMPCYDKKLEASRDDFFNDIYKTRDVDLVLASGTIYCFYIHLLIGEIIDLLNQRKVDFNLLEESPLDKLYD